MKRKYSWDAKKLNQANKRPATGLAMRLRNQPAPRVVPGVTRTAGAYRRAQPNSGELKWVDTTFNIGSAGTTGAVLASNLVIAQGTGENQRIGQKVNLKDFFITFALSNDDATTNGITSGNFRIAIVLDRQANGALPAWTDVFQDGDVSTYRNLDNVDRFKILKDRTFNIPIKCTNAGHTDTSGHYKKFFFKCNLPLHYSSTTGAITELRSNNIVVMYICDVSTCNFQGRCRIKFSDA